MSKNFTSDLTDFDHQAPPTALELIDEAVALTRRAAHCCRDQTAREHFEYALALLTESWVAESGQKARRAARVIADVRDALALFATVAARPLPPSTFNLHP